MKQFDGEQEVVTSARALPKSLQVSEMLIREIASGRLADGSRLPSERKMAADLGIAIGTLRKALATLEEKGLLRRVQGSGNYIQSKTTISSVYTFFRLELLEGGGLPTARVLGVEKGPRPPEAQGFFSDQAHTIRRLRFLNDTPIAVEEISLDAHYTDDVRAEDLSDSLYYFYKEELRLVIAQIEDRVGVSDVPTWAPDDFGLSPKEPAGYIERVSYDQAGHAAEFSKTWFNQNKCRYTNRLR
ncbi:MAG: GntR family transcriptional regulator [Pseudomonadota bacterium]